MMTLVLQTLSSKMIFLYLDCPEYLASDNEMEEPIDARSTTGTYEPLKPISLFS